MQISVPDFWQIPDFWDFYDVHQCPSNDHSFFFFGETVMTTHLFTTDEPCIFLVGMHGLQKFFGKRRSWPTQIEGRGIMDHMANWC